MANTFIDLFLKHTSTYESPTSFWKWSAYTTIAATLRDSCYRRLGQFKLFPNIYVLILAPSAQDRKGFPIVLCEKLIRSVNNTKLISGRSSIQGILDELSLGETDKTTGKIVQGGSAICASQELSAGIVNDPEAIKILTDIYDYKEEYKSILRSGRFQIKNICFSMLSASNEELLRDFYDTKALYGGLLGRTFLVRPNEFRPSNSLWDLRDGSETYLGMVEELRKISNLYGEFQITSEAQKLYNDWYIPFREASHGQSDKSGILGRIHTSIIKLAMILCANYTLSLEIQKEHIEDAIEQCTDLLPNYQSLIMNQGRASDAEMIGQLIETIWRSKEKKISKQDFLAKFFHVYDGEIVDRGTQKCKEAGLLNERLDGSNIIWSLTEKCIEIFKLREKKI